MGSTVTHATIDPTDSLAAVTETVAGWPAVRTTPHRYGGTAFSVGGREIGHLHRSGIVDIAFPRRVRDLLVEAGHTEAHHLYPDSGWTTFRLDGPDAAERASWLLRLSYLYHARAVARRPRCAEALAALDPNTELAGMGLDPGLAAALDVPAR